MAALAWRCTVFQSYLEVILGIWPVNLIETHTFCLSCAKTLRETQTWGWSLNHTRSPGNSSPAQIGHVTERLSHHVSSMEILWGVCTCMRTFAHLYTVCVQSVNSFAGEERARGEERDWRGERELMKGAPDQGLGTNLSPPFVQLCSCHLCSDQHSAHQNTMRN